MAPSPPAAGAVSSRPGCCGDVCSSSCSWARAPTLSEHALERQVGALSESYARKLRRFMSERAHERSLAQQRMAELEQALSTFGRSSTRSHTVEHDAAYARRLPQLKRLEGAPEAAYQQLALKAEHQRQSARITELEKHIHVLRSSGVSSELGRRRLERLQEELEGLRRLMHSPSHGLLPSDAPMDASCSPRRYAAYSNARNTSSTPPPQKHRGTASKAESLASNFPSSADSPTTGHSSWPLVTDTSPSEKQGTSSHVQTVDGHLAVTPPQQSSIPSSANNISVRLRDQPQQPVMSSSQEAGTELWSGAPSADIHSEPRATANGVDVEAALQRQVSAVEHRLASALRREEHLRNMLEQQQASHRNRVESLITAAEEQEDEIGQLHDGLRIARQALDEQRTHEARVVRALRERLAASVQRMNVSSPNSPGTVLESPSSPVGTREPGSSLDEALHRDPPTRDVLLEQLEDARLNARASEHAIAELRAELSASREALNVSRSESTALASELGVANATLTAAKADLRDIRTELPSARAGLVAAERKIAVMQDELAESHAELLASRAALEEAQSHVLTFRETLKEVDSELMDLKRGREDAMSQTETARSSQLGEAMKTGEAGVSALIMQERGVQTVSSIGVTDAKCGSDEANISAPTTREQEVQAVSSAGAIAARYGTAEAAQSSPMTREQGVQAVTNNEAMDAMAGSASAGRTEEPSTLESGCTGEPRPSEPPFAAHVQVDEIRALAHDAVCDAQNEVDHVLRSWRGSALQAILLQAKWSTVSRTFHSWQQSVFDTTASVRGEAVASTLCDLTASDRQAANDVISSHELELALEAQRSELYKRHAEAVEEALEVQRSELCEQHAQAEVLLREAAEQAAERYTEATVAWARQQAQEECQRTIAVVKSTLTEKYEDARELVEMQLTELEQTRRGWGCLSLYMLLSQRRLMALAAALRSWHAVPGMYIGEPRADTSKTATKSAALADDIANYLSEHREEVRRLCLGWATARLRDALGVSPQARKQRAIGTWVRVAARR